MTAVMDVAYLDSPHVEHVGRLELMMRVSPDCWAEDCHDCRIPGCICACHTGPDEPVPLCRRCGYFLAARDHKHTCAERCAARITRLADSIGSAA